MGRPIPSFLGEVADFLDEELLPELYNDSYYYDRCVLRTNYDEQRLKLRKLSFCERDANGDVRRVNDVLSDAEIHLEFHFRGNEPLTGSWTEILTSFSTTLHVPGIEVPTALKWERSGRSGKLKADERFDTDREYVATEVDAKAAMRAGVMEHLYQIVPEFRAQSKAETISSVVLRTMYREDTDILAQLQPNGDER